MSDCINFFVYIFQLFFAWLSSFSLWENISYLTFIIGAFLVMSVVDNFLMKGK